LAARWRGQAGRLEVWYLTWTDRATGAGGWVHLETVSPTPSNGAGSAPFVHGWVAHFPSSGSPRLERLGPEPTSSAVDPTRPSRWWTLADPDADAGWARLEPGATDQAGTIRLRGAAGGLAWDLAVTDASDALWTFPRLVWERELLPGAQMVPMPAARVQGTLTIDGRELDVDGPGALARIYGHGSAQRWGWLHAALDDEGTVLEIVTATARRRALRSVPPLALVQLRRPGHDDWPRRALAAAPRLRTRLSPTGFTVEGRAEGHRISVDVELPATGTVSLQYVDPDGATATCTNSEIATARVTLAGRTGTTAWSAEGTAHAEVGSRP
jgi:hypothetical protein